MPKGQKHLISCRCVLPQFKRRKEPPAHRFVVFSVIEDDNTVRPKYSQCNNCGVIHRITDVGKSEIRTGRDHMGSIVTVDDVRLSLPERIASALDRFSADLPSWEMAQFIVESGQWGAFVVVATDHDGETKNGKIITIFSEKAVKVEAFSYEGIVVEEST